MRKKRPDLSGCPRCGGRMGRIAGILQCGSCHFAPQHDPKHNAPSVPLKGGGRMRSHIIREDEE